MKPVPSQINETLMSARLALKHGDHNNAKRLAGLVVSQAPDIEEAWLILAAISSPQESITYLKRALAINPQSTQARKGMHWAVGRLRDQSGFLEGEIEAPEDDKANATVSDPNPSVVEKFNRPENTSPSKFNNVKKTTGNQPASRSTRPLWRYSVLALLLFIACLLAGVWAVWPGNMLPVQAFLRENISRAEVTSSLPAALAGVLKPTYTATFTPTYTPTPTNTPTPTHTLTPSPTNTPLPTNTPYPTNTPIPLPIVDPGAGGERWVDVDLSEQRVYAYEGSTIVNTFVVSTGTWLHPTVSGRFKIYVKYHYADMSGPGYYLPNVPNIMYFYSGYALHGTYWHSNFGVPMSHGCVNLSIPDSGWLFNWASVGTVVNVHQ